MDKPVAISRVMAARVILANNLHCARTGTLLPLARKVDGERHPTYLLRSTVYRLSNPSGRRFSLKWEPGASPHTAQ